MMGLFNPINKIYKDLYIYFQLKGNIFSVGGVIVKIIASDIYLS